MGALLWWVHAPLNVRALAQGAQRQAESVSAPLHIPAGSSAGGVARRLAQAADGGLAQEWAVLAWLRISGKAAQLKAGSYEIVEGESAQEVIEKIVAGKQSLQSVALIEGWTWRQIRLALSKAPDLKNDTAQMGDAQIMTLLGRAGQHPEGRFFPDTYRYAKNASDLSVLRAALHSMDKQLASAWQARSSDLPLHSPDELLILASIVEKETGAQHDRAAISGVFANRLKIKMRLQTDPSVIYGLGGDFDGNIRKRDLQTDTPYNTYTRGGLPPTPIAMPGQAALLAAAQPAQTKALYFVSRGDGSSAFSETLEEHNRAVRRYIFNR